MSRYMCQSCARAYGTNLGDLSYGQCTWCGSPGMMGYATPGCCDGKPADAPKKASMKGLASFKRPDPRFDPRSDPS